MSFGSSIGDIIAVGQLAWSLYEALKQCPRELKDLSRDLATVYGVLHHLEDDLKSSDSSIKAHGEERIKLLNSMVLDLKTTLYEVQKVIDKFRPAAAESKSMEQLWIKLKYTIGRTKIKRLHQDIAFHISGLNLLLTSIGKYVSRFSSSSLNLTINSSSLHRIESGLELMRAAAIEHDETTKDSAQVDARNEKDQTTELVAKQETKAQELEQRAEEVQSPYESGKSLPNISPVLRIPSRQMEATLSILSTSQHVAIADIVFENCKHAMWELYQLHQRQQLSFNNHDPHPTHSLFAINITDAHPDGPDSFTLKEWIFNITIACNRREPSLDFIWQESSYPKNSEFLLLIPSIITPWGALDPLLFEDGLTGAISWCRYLLDWDSAARLIFLWKELHPENVEEGWQPDLSRSKVHRDK
jgi:hypothetical protein